MKETLIISTSNFEVNIKIYLVYLSSQKKICVRTFQNFDFPHLHCGYSILPILEAALYVFLPTHISKFNS